MNFQFILNKEYIFLGASNSTLQDLKINESSGVFTYADSDDFTSVTSNRIIVWFVFVFFLLLFAVFS